MDLKLVEAIVKGGIGTILSVGMIVILYTVVKDDEAQNQFLRDQMQSQTVIMEQQKEAFERLVKIYAGE